MNPVRAAGAVFSAIVWGAVFVGCSSAQLETNDPTTYVDGVTCPDASGKPQPLIAGYFCCADHDMGPGACPDGTSCMMPDQCSGPIGPNDPGGFMARKPIRRSGL